VGESTGPRTLEDSSGNLSGEFSEEFSGLRVSSKRLREGEEEVANESVSGKENSGALVGGVETIDLDIGGKIDEAPTRVKTDLLDEIGRDLRERKAVKADDAEVPTYLWEEHLVDDDERTWTTKDREKLPWAMDLLRTRMLRWWRHRVTRSSLDWVKSEHENLRKRHKGVIRGKVIDQFEKCGKPRK
jgi:hypothetical protein